MIDIYQFIDSKDIREHCRKLGHPFNTVESAYLVWLSRNTPLAEKHAAWREIIDTMPDYRIPGHETSLYIFLREYMAYEKAVEEEFFRSNDPAVYHYWQLNEEGCMTARRCYANFEDAFEGWDKETKTQEIQKWWMDSAGSYINTMLDARKNLYFAAKGDYTGRISKASYYNDIWISMTLALPTPFHRGDIIQVMGQHELFVLDHMASWTAEESAANGIAPGAVFPEPEYYYNVGEEQEPICYGYSLSGESNMDFYYIGRSDILSFERYTGELEGYQRILGAISAQLKNEIDLGEFLKRGLRFLGQA